MNRKKLNICCDCGEDIEKNNCYTIIDGDYYCEDCINNELAECSYCGEHIKPADFSKTYEGNYICEDCFNTHFTTCFHCEDIVPFDETHNTHNDSCICSFCFDNCYAECSICGYVYLSEDMTYSEEGNYICEDCIETSTESPLIRYSNPKISFCNKGTKDKDIHFFGIELEIECPDANLHDQAEKIMENKYLTDWLWLKPDCSIKHGFEIVSHPSTISVHREKLKILSDILSKDGNGFSAEETTGIHVHTNRQVLSQLEQMKIGLFTYSQKDLVHKIARRKESGYSTYKTKQKVLKEGKNMLLSFDRYEAVNYSNKHTIEIRMFNSATKYYIVMSTIEYTHAIINFVKLYSSVKIVNEGSDKLFIDYVLQNKKQYPNLIELMNEKNIIK